VTAVHWDDRPIGKEHDRKNFDCREPQLNLYLARFARQNHENGAAKTFVAVTVIDPAAVLGYYTLSPASLEYAQTPEILRRGLGRYEVPVFRLAQLAVDKKMQGRGLGGQLLIAAGRRCMAVAEEVGGVALLIDAKHDLAAKWYESFSAVRLQDAPLSLVLPFSTLRSAL
jgi:GNAT superfamily N-acetyltransferase